VIVRLFLEHSGKKHALKARIPSVHKHDVGALAVVPTTSDCTRPLETIRCAYSNILARISIPGMHPVEVPCGCCAPEVDIGYHSMQCYLIGKAVQQADGSA
jgi:hypothetical protein